MSTSPIVGGFGPRITPGDTTSEPAAEAQTGSEPHESGLFAELADIDEQEQTEAEREWLQFVRDVGDEQTTDAKTIRAALKRLGKTRDELKAALEEYQNFKSDTALAATQIEVEQRHNAEREAAEQRVSEAENSVADARQKLNLAQMEHDVASDQLDNLQASHDTERVEIADAKRRLAGNHAFASFLPDEHHELQSRINELSEEHRQADNELKRCNRILSQLNGEGTYDDVHFEPIAKLKRQISHWEDTHPESLPDGDFANRQIAEREAKLNELRSQLAEGERQLSELPKQIEQQEATRDDLATELAEAKRELAELLSSQTDDVD